MLLMIVLCTSLTCHDMNYHESIEYAKKLITAQEFDAAYKTLTELLVTTSSSDTVETTKLANNLLWLGNIYFERGENEKSLDAFKKILNISDRFSAVHHNIGFTLAERFGRHKEALCHYQKALVLNPGNIETHFCAALSHLAQGDLEQGFSEYEYRWQRGKQNSRNFLKPLQNLWNGSDSIWGKTMLIRAEQGLGDTLQFIRYAKILKDRGAFIIAEVQKSLIALLSYCPFLDRVIAIGSELPLFDYQIPLLSLPHQLKTSLKNIPHITPYLFTNSQRIDHWKNSLKNGSRFKIGICWQGDPVHGQAKFMPLQEFLPLLQRNDITVYSLQQYVGLEQLNTIPLEYRPYEFYHDFDKSSGNFIDTAAVMTQLDLVITVDTSLAHLAGGLGVPVWVVLPFPAEWRWLTERVDSPWYPTMTLFRQQLTHNWKPVLNAMMRALDIVLSSNTKI